MIMDSTHGTKMRYPGPLPDRSGSGQSDFRPRRAPTRNGLKEFRRVMFSRPLQDVHCGTIRARPSIPPEKHPRSAPLKNPSQNFSPQPQ